MEGSSGEEKDISGTTFDEFKLAVSKLQLQGFAQG